MTKNMFLLLLPEIREAAKKCGYAIGVHGSLKRDFDLIACPWSDDAVSADELALVVYEAARCRGWRGWWNDNPKAKKPHGRKCYTMDWGALEDNKGYIDLSVMPRRANK